MTRRRKILLTTLAALLAISTCWSYSKFTSARQAAISARSDLLSCYELADRIRTIADRPALACEHEQISAKTTAAIEQAARAARIPAGSLVRIVPQPARRVGETDYKEKPTEVMLRDVTLTQLVRLVHRLAGGDTGLNATSIRLTAPTQMDTSDKWNAEVVLGYLIYEPPTPTRL